MIISCQRELGLTEISGEILELGLGGSLSLSYCSLVSCPEASPHRKEKERRKVWSLSYAFQ